MQYKGARILQGFLTQFFFSTQVRGCVFQASFHPLVLCVYVIGVDHRTKLWQLDNLISRP